MKTYRHLYPQVIAFASLHAAFRKARRGKRGRGEVAAFEFDLERKLRQAKRVRDPHPFG